MELPPELLEAWAWLSDLSGTPQRLIWSAAALVGAYLLGAIVSSILKSIGRRLSGTHKAKANAGNGAQETAADSVVLDIVSSIIKAFLLLGAVAVIADIFGYYNIGDAQGLATMAAKAMLILVGVWFIGAWIARRVRNFGEKVDRTANGGRTLFAFLSSFIRIAALAIGLIAALQQFNFPIASLVAVIGAAGLAIALALQDTLKAVASGVVIAIFRPYKIGDFVRIAGESGTVYNITPFTTVLNTLDNKRLVITNDKAWGDVMENFNGNTTRRIDEIIGISYDDDIDKAMAIVRDIVEADPRCRKDPPVWVKVNELNTSSVDIRFRVWCSANDYFDYRCDLLKAIKEAFDANGVTIPYPHQVEIHKETNAGPPPAPYIPQSDSPEPPPEMSDGN
ncbi:MAG: mechanosensitive ion channel family protein [Hyphomonadaceae bacterium]